MPCMRILPALSPLDREEKESSLSWPLGTTWTGFAGLFVVVAVVVDIFANCLGYTGIYTF